MPEDSETTSPATSEAGDSLPADGESWDNVAPPDAGDTAADLLDREDAENDHQATGDDGEEEVIVSVSQEEAKSGSDHPANPGGLYPIPPKPVLTEWVTISNAERLEKGELFAKKTVEIEKLEAERSEITSEIGKAKKVAILLRNAFLSGKVEVPAEQTDLLRQPADPVSTSAAFNEMGEAAAKAAAEDPPPATDPAAAQTVEELNAMAKDIQAGVPGTEASPQFENDVEKFKAKKAKERKNGKAK